MKTQVLEWRTIKASIRLREDEGKPARLAGYAATFENPSQDLGGHVEVLQLGCFAKSLDGGDQRAFWNHSYDDLLGRVQSGTLRLWEDEIGLAFEIDLPDTTLGRDIYQLVKRGDIDGVSFGFYAIEDRWSADGKTNTIVEAELIEISPVVFPAYLNTKVEARSKRPNVVYKTLERARRIIRLDDE